MAVEVWLRNPDNYIREAIEVGHHDFIWDYGVMRKKDIDPFKLCNLYLGVVPWRAMVSRSHGVSLHDGDHDLENPAAVWPAWEYGESIERLDDLIKKPWGENRRLCEDQNIPKEVRPVFGQEHRVVIAKLPDSKTGIGKKFFQVLSRMQEENPDVTIHLHGCYSYRFMFGLEFTSVDIDPRTLAAKDKVTLPSGKVVTQASSTQQAHWVKLMGMNPVDLKQPRNRCIFNIKSAIWAGEYFQEAIRFKTSGFQHIDPEDPTARIPRNNSVMVKRRKSSPGDKWLCDICNLQTVCKFYRQGAVCIVPESEPVELARFFKTRDSGTIIEGLGTLLAVSSTRLKKALEIEEENESLNPETRKMINDIFDRGTKLAKLVDPALAAAGAARVTTNNLTQINASNPQELMAAILDEFVKKGIPRSQVTPEMIQSILQKPEDMRERAIEAAYQEATGT